VRMGGGVNHRFDLASAALVKDNHVAAGGGIREAIRRARRSGLQVEVEVESLADLEAALAEGADLILLDNMGVDMVAEAVRLNASRGVPLARVPRGSGLKGGFPPQNRAVLEVSGGVSLDTIAAYAGTGVQRISVGALTHSAPALDISMEVVRSWHQ
jgi:nicotinate-nucleotide pyrophosphorylase (carboxylating)